MMNKILTEIGRSIQRMSKRERKLAAGVALFAVAFVVLSGARAAFNSIERLDRRIDQLQDDVRNYHYQVARRQVVEEQFSRVAAQHSSAWSAPEIQDRLRQEIYRLAREVPPPLDDRGIPIMTGNSSANLVEIPSLGQGNLRDGADDYREYSIRLDLPPVEFPRLLAFLQRLQGSPQSLRIDGLELLRPPHEHRVAARRIDLTRTIVAGSASPDVTDAPESIGGMPLLLSEWQCEGGELNSPGGDHQGLVARSTSELAQVFRTQTMDGGSTYEVSVDLRASGDARLATALDESDTLFPGAEALKNDGGLYRYTFRVSVPGNRGQQVRLRVPLIQLEGDGSEVSIEKLDLNQVMG